jgi:protein TonB
MGDGPRTIGDERPAAPIVDETVGRAAADTATSAPVAPVAGPPDSVFSVLEVDTAVVRSASSAAPAYPLKLLEAHIMGSVSAQYIVDTTGFADTSSFHVMKSTNPEFIAAVREALPYMRFTPAKIGSIKVRQLVEQQFSFKITDTAVVTPKRKP